MAPTEQAFASSAAPQKLENIPTDQYVGAGLSRSVPSDSLQPHGLWPTRLLCPRGFSRPEHWSGLPCPTPDLPDPGTEPRSAALQADSLPAEPPRKPTSSEIRWRWPNPTPALKRNRTRKPGETGSEEQAGSTHDEGQASRGARPPWSLSWREPGRPEAGRPGRALSPGPAWRLSEGLGGDGHAAEGVGGSEG